MASAHNSTKSFTPPIAALAMLYDSHSIGNTTLLSLYEITKYIIEYFKNNLLY